jgi:TetR/AcrR family transcriptional regulator
MQKPNVHRNRTDKPRRGRPLAVQTQEYRQKILDSAEQAFAISNFDSVSLKQIAEPVGVTAAMVHYYFGTKLDLLAEVLDQALAPMAAAISELNQKQATDVEEVVKQLFSTMQLHPNLPLLLFRQVLLPGSPMQDYFLENLAPRLGGALPGLIRNGQKSGRMATDLDPGIAALMVLSLCVFPLLSRPLSQPVLGVNFDQAGLAKLQKHVLRFIRGGLNNP